MKNLTIIFAIKCFLISIVLFLMLGCERDENNYFTDEIVYDTDSNQPLVAFILDRSKRSNIEYNNQLRKTINYTKIPYRQLDVRSFNKNGTIPETVKVLVIQSTMSLSNKAMRSIIDYTARGNMVYFPNVSEDKKFGFLAGIKRSTPFTTNTIAKDFNFKKTIIPDFKNRLFSKNSIHYGFNRDNYKEDVEVWSTAINDTTYPTILKHRIGNGQVVTMNSTIAASKQIRGLLFGTILSGLEQVPYPIASVSTMFLDDFPAPLYKTFKEPINAELKMNQADFYVKRWWPDLIKLAKKKNIKYTTVACFDYRGNTEPPFLFNEWESIKPDVVPGNNVVSDLLMMQVIKQGHESGLHGYNHQSLIKRDWPNPDFMETSLISANKRWKSLEYGDLPVSYVPPSNHIDSLGIMALEKGTPTIKIMASTYFGDFKEGGNREYDYEPYSHYIFDFPRVTSGYILDEESQFDQQSTYLYTGIWSHFIHPDDVYQIPDKSNSKSKGIFEYRNGENYGWEISEDGSPGMLPRFEKYLDKTQKLFPMMRFLTTKKATSITKSWRKSNYTYAFNNEELKLNSNNTVKDSYWFMYVTNQNKTKVENDLKNRKLNFTKIALLDGYLYNIATQNAEILLTHHNSKKSNSNVDFSAIQLEYDDYLSDKLIFKTVDEEIKYLVSIEELDKAIFLLRNKIKNNSEFVEQDWLDLGKYYGWNGQDEAIWPFLNLQYLQLKSKEHVLFSKFYSGINGYPNLRVRKMWMERQLLIFPNDTQLKSEYDKFFVLKEDSDLSTNKIISFLNTSSNSPEKTNFFLVLLERDPVKAKQFLNNIEPCKEDYLIAISDQIAWFYADQESYKTALEWSKCTTKIDSENITYWRTSIGEFEFLKTSNYPQYIQYLLQHNPPRALQELINNTPCKTEGLIEFGEDIAYAFGNIGAYRKALDWAGCSPNVAVSDQLQWYLELKNYKALKDRYALYKAENPEDGSVDFVMIEVYLSEQNYRKAFGLFEKLASGAEKNNLQKRLNEEVLYINNVEQQYLLKTHPSVFYPEVRDQLNKEIRLNTGNTIAVNSNVLADRLNPTYLNNQIIYSVFNKKSQKHSFGLSQSQAYLIPVDFIDSNNRDKELYGLLYGFNSKVRENKINYNFISELQLDTAGNTFYDLEAGASRSKQNSFSNLILAYNPVNTGPGYSLDIYNTQIQLYQELTFKKKYQTTLSLEGNHFNDDNVVDGTLITKFEILNKLGPFSQWSPYVEGAGMLGNANRSSGYPYWTIKERFYGGLGVGYIYEKPSEKIKLSLNVAGFKDTFSDEFLRFSGQVSYPIFNYFYLNANAEFFTLKNFYSNNINLGLKYYFKKR